MKICPYCGNKSGLVDRLGGCVTCGGQLDMVSIPTITPIQNGWMSVSEARQMLDASPYGGVSGGQSIIPPQMSKYSIPELQEQEIRATVRRAVGLD